MKHAYGQSDQHRSPEVQRESMETAERSELKVFSSVSVSGGTEGDRAEDEMPARVTAVEHRMVTGTWEVTTRWPTMITGGPVELVIRASREANPESVERGITVDTLRSIPLAKMTRDAQEMLNLMQKMERECNLSEVIEGMASQINCAVRSVPRPGRAGRSDDFFALVAALYSWYVDLGYPNPVRKMEDIIGCNWRAVANWVRLARVKGMLTEVSPGRRGGLLTTKAMRILESQGYHFNEIFGQYFLVAR
ncbi:hypothetical protein F8568_045295 [Actinomadura sp. LD22]|uniref:Uncharacterized protein n=1 Tax=Actinomadura physcomitrii TaxID=2650748 RepID=A0A6I4MNX2_9ACTN|nr:hypothetical protein [Actinomadura physcomitrii]MWA07423.1 hypothetical protein [Actinomadura physcomitrii]